jgi:hypothetical protein
MIPCLTLMCKFVQFCIRYMCEFVYLYTYEEKTHGLPRNILSETQR